MARVKLFQEYEAVTIFFFLIVLNLSIFVRNIKNLLDLQHLYLNSSYTVQLFNSYTLLKWIVLQPSMELWFSRRNPFRQLEATSSWFFFLILHAAIWQQESTQQSIWKTCHAWENIKEKIWKQEMLPLLIPLHKKVACHLCQSISHCTSLLCVISILCLSLAYQATLCQGSSLFGYLLGKNNFFYLSSSLAWLI